MKVGMVVICYKTGDTMELLHLQFVYILFYLFFRLFVVYRLSSISVEILLYYTFCVCVYINIVLLCMHFYVCEHNTLHISCIQLTFPGYILIFLMHSRQ